jgi:signal transduction histidine kinase
VEQTKFYELSRRWAQKAGWWALSVPIFVKILGIGLLTTVLFGTVAFYQIRMGMLRTHYQMHGEAALSLAMSLAGRLDPLVEGGNASGMNVEVNRTMGEFPDVRYIVVQNAQGAILSHGFTFPKEAPADLLGKNGDMCAACHASLSPTEVPRDLLETKPNAQLSSGRLRAYTRNEGLILEVEAPIGSGKLGTVRLGVGDKIIAREMGSITQSLAISLTLCMVVGLSLAGFLASVLVRPIRDLVQATHRLREGDFAVRANVFSLDEIGHLASVFNRMAEGMETYRRAVEEKEAARQMLIGKIVRAQEEERKHVARELHDQLGQMLSKTLLTIDTACVSCENRHPLCPEIRNDIRGMIDEVRMLAWNVRPSILDDYGLNRALEQYIGQTAKRVSFSLDYQSVIPPDTERFAGPEVEATLYRIAQEAITNIIRHAKATQASVILMCRENEIVLLVEDNGVGFDMKKAESSRTLGLMGMRERAVLVGGELTIDSEAGKGTTIRVRIPLKSGDAPKLQTGLENDGNTNSAG